MMGREGRTAWLTEEWAEAGPDGDPYMATGLFRGSSDADPDDQVGPARFEEVLAWARERAERVVVRTADNEEYNAGAARWGDLPPLPPGLTFAPRRPREWQHLDRTEADPPIEWDVAITPLQGWGEAVPGFHETFARALRATAGIVLVDHAPAEGGGSLNRAIIDAHPDGFGWMGRGNPAARAVVRVAARTVAEAQQLGEEACAAATEHACAETGWSADDEPEDLREHLPAWTFAADAYPAGSWAARRNARIYGPHEPYWDLPDAVRANAAAIAADARFISIDLDRLGGVEPGPPPTLDPQKHYLEGDREDVALYLLALDAINFGSGWFPTLNKRPGCSGYYTISWALADHWRAGGWDAEQLADVTTEEVARVLAQDRHHELMHLYAVALRQFGRMLTSSWDGSATAFIDAGDLFVGRIAGALKCECPFFDDTGFWKRAQIAANDLHLAGIAEFEDIDRLTIFADNLVPHVLRVDGVLRYDAGLAARIEAGELIPSGSREEREIRGCAVHACELIARELGIPPRDLDVMLWNRGQGERYKSRPRHRTRTVFY